MAKTKHNYMVLMMKRYRTKKHIRERKKMETK